MRIYYIEILIKTAQSITMKHNKKKIEFLTELSCLSRSSWKIISSLSAKWPLVSSFSAKELRLLYHCTDRVLKAFSELFFGAVEAMAFGCGGGFCSMPLLKLMLRRIGWRPRLMAAGKSALPFSSVPSFRRSEGLRSSFTPVVGTAVCCFSCCLPPAFDKSRFAVMCCIRDLYVGTYYRRRERERIKDFWADIARVMAVM